MHEGENATHLLTGEHLGNIGFLSGSDSIDLLVQRRFEEPFVEKNQGVHGLVLRGGGHIFFTSEMGKEGFDFLFFPTAKVFPPHHFVETDEALNPVTIRSLRVD